MQEFDLVIKNGMIIDGARNPRWIGDIGVKDGVIARMGNIANTGKARVLDATGLIVAPGFIDLHTHYDAQIFWDPYLSTSGQHGVTSIVLGNCGFGFAPMVPELRDRAMQSMTRVEQIPLAALKDGLPWDWESFPEYLDSLDRVPKALNVLPYVPVNPLLIAALGITDAKAGRMPTDAEHAEIVRLLNEAMDAGACGWSAQCIGTAGRPDLSTGIQTDFDGTPMPTDVMHPETRAVLAQVLRDRGEGFIELSMAMGSLEEWEQLAAISRAPMLFQALIPSGDPMMVAGRQYFMQWLDSCQQRGLRIYGQGITQNPPLIFTFDCWDLWGQVWDKYTGPDVKSAEKLVNFSSPEVRAILREQPLKYQFIDSIADTRVHKTFNAQNKAFEGKLISEIANETGKNPVDVLCDIVAADELKTIFETRQFDTTLDGIRELINNNNVIPGLSDGGAHLKFLSAGSYGTEMISEYVRKHAMTTLEEAHWRLSALPAYCAGFRDRGTLREGAAADIIVYDYEKLTFTFPEFVYDLPGGEYRVTNRGSGYRYTLVNGQVTIDDDKPTNTHAGELLRNGRAREKSVKNI